MRTMSNEHLELCRVLSFLFVVYSACMVFGVALTAITSKIFERIERNRNAK